MEEVGNERIEDPAVVEIVNSIEQGLPASAGREASCAICRAPKLLRQANEKGFDPQLVSVGPYHHGKDGLKHMEGQKFQHLRSILSRNSERKLADYVKEIKTLEAEARKCYSESISLERNDFVKMLVLDGCFLVEIFLRIHTIKIHEETWLPQFISGDMLLLENQLPFFVLKRIFCLVVPQQSPGSMKELALHCFKLIHVMPLNKAAKAKESYHHLLDLFHHHCVPPARCPSEKNDEADSSCIKQLLARLKHHVGEARLDPDIEEQSHEGVEEQFMWTPAEEKPRAVGSRAVGKPLEKPLLEQGRRGLRKRVEGIEQDKSSKQPALFAIPSAEVLQDAGIEFKRKEEKPGSFLDIEFQKKGVIKIPYLFFSDNLKSILQNFIAYEQCHPDAGTFFTGYSLFMDDVINTAKDVQILRHSNILEHGLGSDEELAQHFNQLSKGIFHHAKDTHLYRERMDINEYCGSWWNSSRAYLTRKYFYSPWAFMSLVGALLGLALTIVQTGAAVKSAFF